MQVDLERIEATICRSGLEWLNDDMEMNAPFDPNQLYDEKNRYFGRAVTPGLVFLRTGQYGTAEIYFKKMLERILEYERAKGKKFNKGMVYANLGIAQMPQIYSSGCSPSPQERLSPPASVIYSNFSTSQATRRAKSVGSTCM